jgi:hypothetical protein
MAQDSVEERAYWQQEKARELYAAARKENQEVDAREAAYAASHERRAAGLIVKHMWIIAVGIPLVMGILLVLLQQAK